MPTKSALFNVLDAWVEAARFYADVQYVMALRMMRLALGVSPAATEAWQVSEKVFLVQRPRHPAGRTDVLARTVPSQQPTG